jgi:indole-3-glycerol phosphate synthase
VITRLHSRERQKELLDLAAELGMECLVEVHSERELEQALTAGAKVIGINNRDLKTFKTDTETTVRLRPIIPPEVVVVSESGISSPAVIRTLKKHGVDAVLIGEALMSAGDIAAKLRELVAAGTR